MAIAAPNSSERFDVGHLFCIEIDRKKAAAAEERNRQQERMIPFAKREPQPGGGADERQMESRAETNIL